MTREESEANLNAHWSKKKRLTKREETGPQRVEPLLGSLLEKQAMIEILSKATNVHATTRGVPL